MNNFFKKISLRLLALLPAILPMSKAKAAENTDSWTPSGSLVFFNNAERNNHHSDYGEQTWKPTLRLSNDDKAFEFAGSYFHAQSGKRVRDTDWINSMTQFSAQNADYALKLGRMNLREYAGYCLSPQTVGFDDRSIAKGAGLAFTGMHFESKSTGLGIGWVSDNNNMLLRDWDSALITWHHDFSPKLGLQTHLMANSREISRGGFAMKYAPNTRWMFVGEGIYKNKSTTLIGSAHWKLSDRLKLFSGVQTTTPNHGKTSGMAVFGLDYAQKDTGVHFFIAGQQNIGGDRGSAIVAGVRFSGLFKASPKDSSYTPF